MRLPAGLRDEGADRRGIDCCWSTFLSVIWVHLRAVWVEKDSVVHLDTVVSRAILVSGAGQNKVIEQQVSKQRATLVSGASQNKDIEQQLYLNNGYVSGLTYCSLGGAT